MQQQLLWKLSNPALKAILARKWPAYHLTKTSEIFETGTNGTKNSWEKIQKMRKLLNFRKANLPKFQDESQMERKLLGKFLGVMQICNFLLSAS